MAKKSSLGSLLINLELQTATLNKQVKDINKKFSGLTNTFKKVGIALAGAFALKGLANTISNTLKFNDALGKTADRLGLTAKELQQLHFASEQSGISTATLEMALQRMTRRVSEAGKGTGEAVKALKEMNIEASELAKMSVNEQLNVLADALSGVENEADQVRLAMKLFDSEGVKLLTMLKNGSEGLKTYAEEANALGFVLDRQMIAKMEDANDSMHKVQMTGRGFSNLFTVALAPAITTVANSFVGMWKDSNDADKTLKNMTKTVAVLVQGLDVLTTSVTTSIAGYSTFASFLSLVWESNMGTAVGALEAQEKFQASAEKSNIAVEKWVSALAGNGVHMTEFLRLSAEVPEPIKRSTKATTALNKELGKTKKIAKEIKVELTDWEQFMADSTMSLAQGGTSMFRAWMDGATDFKTMFGNILKDITAQMFYMLGIKQLLGGFGSMMGGSVGNILSGFAQGGAIQGGVQAFASGGIVNSPTVFPMASGMGLMGEAGAEAIMPLTRTSSGNLGVEATASPMTVNVNNYGNDEVSVDQTGQYIDITIAKISNDITRGTGTIGTAMESRYGLKKQ